MMMGNRIWIWFKGKASLRTKLILSFSVLVSAAVIALGSYSFFISNKNLVEQTERTMESNVSSIVLEMESRFSRETDFTKYLAYNLNFRETLEASPFNYIKLAQMLNKTVEPILWYFITSDENIKAIQIVSPYVDKGVGVFLTPSADYENEQWYLRHKTDFSTVWSVEGDRLYATRTILDTATTSHMIGIMRTEFYLGRMLEPVKAMDYLHNGILVLDEAGQIVYQKDTPNSEIAREVLHNVLAEQEDSGKLSIKNSRYILKSAKLQNPEWRIYYYIDRAMISDQVRKILTSTLFVVFLCLGVSLVFITLFSKTLSSRILNLKKQAEQVAGGNLDSPCYTEDTDEIGVVTNSFGAMTERLNEMINQVYKIEIEKKETELKALQAMINPHFLYNCLSTIKWKALRQGDDEISDITGLIAKFYRSVLNNGKQITTVYGELENIKSYVEIQKRTHDFSFDVEYRIDETGMDYQMLNFLLQPIVENAIKHGIDYKAEESSRGLVIIEYGQDETCLIFNIYNNGPAIAPEKAESILNTPGEGYGIFNIRERIELYYGSSCGLSVKVTEEGYTCFSVKILKMDPAAE